MKKRMIYLVDETRDKILSTAEKIFTEMGFFETQMKDIANQAAISRNTVYRYFHDKSDLAMTIIERIIYRKEKEQQEQIDQLRKETDLTGLKRFEKILNLNWLNKEQICESKLMAEFDAYYSGVRISEMMKKRFFKLESSNYENLMVSLIDEGKEDGSIRSDIDSHLIFVTTVNSIRALKQRIILRGDVLVEVKENEIQTILPQLMKLLMAGLKNAGEKDEN
jgi:AcrR family transcriptional regulator